MPNTVVSFIFFSLSTVDELKSAILRPEGTKYKEKQRSFNSKTCLHDVKLDTTAVA